MGGTSMRAKAWSRIGRIAVVSVLAALILTSVPVAGARGVYWDRWQVKRATNHSRVNHEVRRVTLHDRLSELARKHSLAMARRGELFHTKDPGSTYLRGIRWSRWGENVGMTPGAIGGLQQAFMASAPHRANILNRSFRHVAIGAVRRDGFLWVTVFFWG